MNILKPQYYDKKALRSQAGFSTILALLLTGFLLTLSAGVLFLFLSESRTNQALFNGIGAHYAADGALEYALLKIKNHREGFEDSLVMTLTGATGNIADGEGERMSLGKGPRAPHMQYDIEAAWNSYSGWVQANAFEIIPLFIDPGKVIKSQLGWAEWKHPTEPGVLIPIANFKLSMTSGERIVWNIIGNNAAGYTYGISGIIGDESPGIIKNYSEGGIGTQWNGSEDTKGKFRVLESQTLSESEKKIREFLAEYQECYLVLYNPASTGGGQIVKYEITADKEFTLPRTKIVASGRMRDSIVNLELTENKTKLFELLKYSLYVAE